MKNLLLILITTSALISCINHKSGNTDETGDVNSSVALQDLGGRWYVNYHEDTIWSRYGTLSFDTSEHRYSAFDGCNHMSGYYKYSEGNFIFEEGSGTMKHCPCSGCFGIPDFNMPLKISTTKFYNTEGIKIGDGVFASILLREGRWMLSGLWDVTEVGGVVLDDKIKMIFDIDSNIVSIQDLQDTGSFLFEDKDNNKISFQTHNNTTQLKSNNINTLVTSLNSVSFYRPSGSNGGCCVNICLKDSMGNNIVILQRNSERYNRYAK